MDPIAYHALDNNDENTYNALQSQAKRLGFIYFVQKLERDDEVPAINRGQAITDLWLKRCAYRIGKAKKRSKEQKVVVIHAIPPTRPVPAPAPALAPVPAPAPAPPARPKSIPVFPASPSSPGSEVESSSRSEESDASGEISPTFFFRNDPGRNHFHSPTRGTRKHVQNYLSKEFSGEWRFAKSLHNSQLDEEDHGFLTQGIWLFVNLTDSGQIEDRVVVKCINVGDGGKPGEKRTETGNELHLPTSLDRAITEWTIARQLQPLSCRNILRYRAQSRRRVRKFLKELNPGDGTAFNFRNIYTDYAPLGDLYGLFERCITKQRHIPEHYIWYVFKCLIDALSALHEGACEDTDPTTEREAWDPIWHLDIKEGNIFLGDADDKYTSYKRPLLADFDLSVPTSVLPKELSARDKTISTYRQVGTDHWAAPEHSRVARSRYEEDNPGCEKEEYCPKYTDIGTASDIFAVALVIQRLMVCSAYHPEATDPAKQDIYARYDGVCNRWGESVSIEADDRQYVPTHGFDEYPTDYNLGLFQIVDQCLHYLPKNRPSLKDLRNRINGAIGRLDELYGSKVTAYSQDIIESLRVDFPVEDSRFRIDEPYEPTAKRRHLQIEGIDAEHEAEARDLYIRLVKEIDEESYEEDYTGKPLDAIFQRWMKKRRSDDTVNSIIHTLLPEQEKAVSDHSKALALETLQKETQDLNQFPTPEHAHVRLLYHAVQWGQCIMQLQGQPDDLPRLRKLPRVHKGVPDYIYHQPSGAFEG
ncbi:kinase-like domain-containing protein [Lophiotrema nucula]|uniref:Kinase-like domain-containing protein n=1 Tax=Lophiotrema nucula TaxID=690887 RepID=A0A6A5YL60_9PLEO|nr:kinase-like domain-containing protein [Lophiotrema nucula]